MKIKELYRLKSLILRRLPSRNIRLFEKLTSYRKRKFNLYGNLFYSNLLYRLLKELILSFFKIFSHILSFFKIFSHILSFFKRFSHILSFFKRFFYFVIHTKRADCIIIRNSGYGFFSNIFQTLGMIEFCKVNKINLILDYTAPGLYSLETKNNILLDCFEKYSFTFNQNKNKRKCEIKDRLMLDSINIMTRQFNGITPEEIRENIRLMKIREDILEEVNAFYNKHFINKKVIGIHYRGTDSYQRGICMPYNDVIDYLLKNFQGEYYFYVATDEEMFLTNIKKNFPNKIISSNVTRSKNNQALHKDPLRQKKSHLTREVMIDSLLLAKTSFLIRLDSNVSFFSVLYNKNLKFITLGNSAFPLRKKMRNEIDEDEVKNVDIKVLN